METFSIRLFNSSIVPIRRVSLIILPEFLSLPTLIHSKFYLIPLILVCQANTLKINHDMSQDYFDSLVPWKIEIGIESEGIFKGHLFPLPCSEEEHTELHQVLRALSPELRCLPDG